MAKKTTTNTKKRYTMAERKNYWRARAMKAEKAAAPRRRPQRTSFSGKKG